MLVDVKPISFLTHFWRSVLLLVHSEGEGIRRLPRVGWGFNFLVLYRFFGPRVLNVFDALIHFFWLRLIIIIVVTRDDRRKNIYFRSIFFKRFRSRVLRPILFLLNLFNRSDLPLLVHILVVVLFVFVRIIQSLYNRVFQSKKTSFLLRMT